MSSWTTWTQSWDKTKWGSLTLKGWTSAVDDLQQEVNRTEAYLSKLKDLLVAGVQKRDELRRRAAESIKDEAFGEAEEKGVPEEVLKKILRED